MGFQAVQYMRTKPKDLLMTTSLTPAEYKKRALPVRDETQMLLAVNSRFEDAGGKRIHIMPTLEEPILIRERKKVTGLHVPTVDHANNLDLLEEYSCTLTRPLWVRPPFILPSSWAPWSLEAGRQYMLACGLETSPYPTAALTSRQSHWEWCLENLKGQGRFIPHDLPESVTEVTRADVMEMHIRMWDDARGPGHPDRKSEILRITYGQVQSGHSLDVCAPILPTDRDALFSTPVDESFQIEEDATTTWNGWEESIWAGILDDPDIDLFGLDVDESKDWETTKNLFLESDNLLALKRLRCGYTGKVKLTYIDPPYNTGNKFVYNDNFKSAPNTGSPFLGQRWGRGTWLTCQLSPWVNVARLAPKELIEVDDSMLYPRADVAAS